MYYKGGNMLHTIRQVINDDEKWRSILRGIQKDFWHQTVTTQQIESYISLKSGIDFRKVFDQYLRTTKIPVVNYRIDGNKIFYRYENVVPGFEMPLKVLVNGNEMTIKPGETEKTLSSKGPMRSFEVDRNFYVNTVNGE